MYLDKTEMEPNEKGKLCALAFKVVHDFKRGLIVYCRVYPCSSIYVQLRLLQLDILIKNTYSGILRVVGAQNQLFNVTEGIKEKAHRLAQVCHIYSRTCRLIKILGSCG